MTFPLADWVPMDLLVDVSVAVGVAVCAVGLIRLFRRARRGDLLLRVGRRLFPECEVVLVSPVPETASAVRDLAMKFGPNSVGISPLMLLVIGNDALELYSHCDQLSLAVRVPTDAIMRAGWASVHVWREASDTVSITVRNAAEATVLQLAPWRCGVAVLLPWSRGDVVVLATRVEAAGKLG